ncbi:MAG TPA: hypothetical protein VFB85_02425 [Vicinamibacterales bacterium]|jgi:hypothetical protein|nr:hypothetical protein [Vicinamibacterales bacterium]
MTVSETTALLDTLAWPVVVLIVLAFFRRQLVALVERVREIEGPADLKITLDAQKVEQIITKGRQANATPAAVAQQIVRSATVLEKRETRILRALLDDDGRGMFNYQTDYYKPALMALVSKGLVQRQDKGFALTPEGMRVTKEYLTTVLESGTAAASSGSAGQNSGS